MRCLERLKEARVTGRSAVDQRLEGRAVNACRSLSCADAFALRGFEGVEHFGQIGTKGVAGDVGGFVCRHVAKVHDLTDALGDQRSSDTAAGFKGGAFQHVAGRLNKLRRALTRGFAAQVDVGQFKSLFTDTIAKASTGNTHRRHAYGACRSASSGAHNCAASR